MICIALAIGLLALFAFKRHRYRHAWGGCHRGGRSWHHHHHHDGPWDEPHGGGPGPRGIVRFLSWRLHLSPEQEKVVRAEVDRLRDQVRNLRDERDKTRGDLARSMRGDGVDEVVLGEMFARHDERLESVRGEVVSALGRVHAVLDPPQRERLADLIEQGLRGGFGPYRV